MTPEQVGVVLAVAAADDGFWIPARPPGRTSGRAREWWPGMIAGLHAADPASSASLVTDPDGICSLKVTKPGEDTIRFIVGRRS